MEARDRLLQTYDGQVTIRRTLLPAALGRARRSRPSQIASICRCKALPVKRRPYGFAVGCTVEAGDGDAAAPKVGEAVGVALPAGKTPAPESGAGEEPGDG